MSHQTFKVSIVINDTVENFYIKHYIDDFQPVFQKFKSLVFQRNPAVSVSNLKIYWIDAENDKILISCEEDFRLFIEQGAGRKVFFSVKNGQPQPENDGDVAMEAEESVDRSKAERRARKSLIRDEEKQKRNAKRLAEKMRCAEEKLRSHQERCSKNPEKYERKSAERLERAKKRCDQIRQIIGSIDPANLSPSGVNAGASTSAASAPVLDASIDESLAILHPSAETIRLLSNAIAGCLQPCNLINKILNEIIGMVPQPTAEPVPLSDQQQQTEVPSQASAATNTSNVNTPAVPLNPSSQEIEALFKEAAKELEKMNEIVNNSSRSGSLASSMTGITQVERVFANISDSAFSDATIIDTVDAVEANQNSPVHDFNIVSPPKSMRSRESSIEVHDVNSLMSDDSRDWTILDASNEQEDESIALEGGAVKEVEDVFISDSAKLIAEEKKESIKFVAEEKKESIKSVETQTVPLVASRSAASSMSQEQMQASIKASIESVGKMNDIVKNSIASAQQSLQNIPVVVPAEAPRPIPVLRLSQAQILAASIPSALPAASVPIAIPAPTPSAPLRFPSAMTQANWSASRASSGAVPRPSGSPTRSRYLADRLLSGPPPAPAMPAVIVYDPNPKINAAVHQMVNMGFSNEDGWLTQLLVNVDGDVVKAINFLTPRPKGNDGKGPIVMNFD